MSTVNVINEKKNALLEYKVKILEEIKYYERTIDDFRATHKNNGSYEIGDSSDSEDDFPHAIDMGPSIPQLKIQKAMLKTCLHATQELTGLTVLQSEVNVLVEEPKLDGERPVTEPGTWREVTAECRIDLVPFTVTFLMHTPNRKFAAPSYGGLRIVPVKYAHEMELNRSVLHTLKVPSDAIEVLKSYAVGHRSRRTTLARLANKYANSLFMEPHSEGGFVLKCAELLEISWRLENKWSPVAPFHHRMKFDVEYMDESYIKIITQAHKQLSDPAIQTDERTLLLATIISTCLEVRGPVDPDSDLESKTTERDIDTDKRDSENEKRDSEVMAPPKNIPKKLKQKPKDSLPIPAQKRSMHDENSDSSAKKMKNNEMPFDGSTKTSAHIATNARKSKMNDMMQEGAKKSRTNDLGDKTENKVANNKNVEDTDISEDRGDNLKPKYKNKTKDKGRNTKPKTANEIDYDDEKDNNTKLKNKNTKDSGNTENVNTKSKNLQQKNIKMTAYVEDKDCIRKQKNVKNKESVNTEGKDVNTKPKNKNLKNLINTEDKNDNTKSINKKLKEFIKSGDNENNTKTKNKIVKESVNAGDKDDKRNANHKNLKESGNVKDKDVDHTKSKNKIVKDSGMTEPDKFNDESKNINDKQPTNTEHGNDNMAKSKNIIAKEAGNPADNDYKDNTQPKNTEKKKTKNVVITKNSKDTEVNKNTEIKSTKDVARQKCVTTVKKNNVASQKKEDINSNKTVNKPKTTETAKNKENNIAKSKIDNPIQKRVIEIKSKIKEKPESSSKDSEKIVKVKKAVYLKPKSDIQTIKKVTENKASNVKNKDKISQINNKVADKVVKDSYTTDIKETPPEKVDNCNLENAQKSKKITSNIPNTKNVTKELTKTIKSMPHRISTHRNALKVQNPIKTLKTGISKLLNSGNAENENNSSRITKIPQKKLSSISEVSSKKNMLRISPRKILSKFKSSSQANIFKQKMVKTTNIPRLMKKPAPKTIQ